MKTPQNTPRASGEDAHTPTPYSLHTAYDCRYSPAVEEIVIIGQGAGIAKMLKSGRSGLDPANAAFIVRACNSHAALVDALEDTIRSIEGYLAVTKFRANDLGKEEMLMALGKARSALSFARSENGGAK